MPALFWSSTNVGTANGGPTLGDWRNAVVDIMQRPDSERQVPLIRS